MKEDVTVKQAYDILLSFGALWKVLDPEEREVLREIEREANAREKATQAEQEPKKK